MDDKTTRRRIRDIKAIVVSMLEHWGEWERCGFYAASAQQSILGKLIKDGPGAPCGAFCSSIPSGIIIPADVALVDKLIARMRDETRSGDRYEKVIRRRFVHQKEVDRVAICRAIKALARIYQLRVKNPAVHIWDGVSSRNPPEAT